jgi:hypothetical protein
MCGLIIARAKKGGHTGNKVYSLYQKQRARGHDGFGYIAIKDGAVVDIRRAKTEDDIKKHLDNERAPVILFHHRLPTSTKNTIGTTHPMFVSNKELKHDYYIAHNGIITNAASLKAKHEALGYVYNTEFSEDLTATYSDGTVEHIQSNTTVFNDSEALAIELARYLEGISDTVATTGGAAFWGVKLEKGTSRVVNIFVGKNAGRDLKQEIDKKWFVISSQTGRDLKPMVIHQVDLKTHAITELPLPIDEAKPVTTNYGFRDKSKETLSLPYRAPVTSRNVHTETSFKNKKSYINSYDNLCNAFYTHEQAIDSGVPFTEFFTSFYQGHKYFVPIKFVQYQDNRLTLDELMSEAYTKDEDPTDKLVDEHNKALERLEALARKYAKIEIREDQTTKDLSSRKISLKKFNLIQESIDKRRLDIEDEISTLPLPESTIDEYIEFARDIVEEEMEELIK